MTKFQLGTVVVTRGVYEEMAENEKFAKFVFVSLMHHASGEWGVLCEEDKQSNEEALAEGLRIFSAYKIEGLEEIWIITEADRSITTVLFPREY